MMLRLCLLLIAIYQVSAAWDVPRSCYACPAGYFQKSTRGGSFSIGPGTSISCAGADAFAEDIWKADRDACTTLHMYVNANCGCSDRNGNKWVPRAIDTSSRCNTCAVPAKNSQKQVTVSHSGSSLVFYCPALAQASAASVFTGAWCQTVNQVLSSQCCSRRRNLRGDDQEEEATEVDAELFEYLADWKELNEAQEELKELLEETP